MRSSSTTSNDGTHWILPTETAVSSKPKKFNGSKGGSGVAQQIINQIPPHRVYIEPFLGKGAVLRAKRAAHTTIGIDVDGDVLHDYWTPAPDGCTIVHGDALEWLRSYDWQGDECVYCDPPYLFETRGSGDRGLYQREFGTWEQHQQLVLLVRSLPCAVLISGYWSTLYAQQLGGWRSISYTTVRRSGETATEYLWMNYSQPLELHDYRFLGNNYREREKIAKQQRRWKAKLQRMSPTQRYAMFAALDDLRAARTDIHDDGADGERCTNSVASIDVSDEAGPP